MDRRTYLATAGAALTGIAGCLGDGDAGTTPSLTDETDGYPNPDVVETPAEDRDVDVDSFETLAVGGVAVPLVPVDVAHYWFQRREARFADARGEGQYERSHVTGAVLSTARRVENWGEPRDGPTARWDSDDRIVCYCGCPHHLSSLRAGEFLDKGYENVYAIDEGYGAWVDRGYPATGVDGNQQAHVIRGRTDADAAGEYAWAIHEASDQQEAAPIESDGSYRIELQFADVDAATPLFLQTPSYELTAPLSELTAGVVTASTA